MTFIAPEFCGPHGKGHYCAAIQGHQWNYPDVFSGMHLLKHLTVNGLHRSMGPSMTLWSYLDGITTLYAAVMKNSNDLHNSHIIPGIQYCFTKKSSNAFTKCHLCHLHCHKWVSVVHALLKLNGLQNELFYLLSGSMLLECYQHVASRAQLG